MLALESDISRLNLCCTIRCVTLSRYLNFSELQFPHLRNGDHYRNFLIRVLGKFKQDSKE